jgi:hypothetical protein
MLVTDRRVIRWRPPGLPASLGLTSVERMKLNPAKPDRAATLVIVGADGRSSLSLSLEPHHVAAVGGFTIAMAVALKAAAEQLPQPVSVDQLGYGSLRVWAFRAN